MGRKAKRGNTVSRHHILPPIVYTPAPPKPKETRRRRGVGSTQGTRAADEADETEEAGEVSYSAAATGPSSAHQPALPTETAERHVPSTTGNLSADTLRVMLEVQEQETADSSPAKSTR